MTFVLDFNFDVKLIVDVTNFLLDILGHTTTAKDANNNGKCNLK
jgi:hypothetical protein